jgi:hypothetical protein
MKCWQHNRIDCTNWVCRMRAQDSMSTVQRNRMERDLLRARDIDDKAAIAILESKLGILPIK